MGFESYISENEAASIAGVGVPTLRRFAEAGYFKIETENDGLKLYARSDLEKVFGLKSKATPAAPKPQFKEWTPLREMISPESNGSPNTTPPLEAQVIIERVVTNSQPSEELTQSPAPQQTEAVVAAPQAQPALVESIERELQKQHAISEMHERLLLMREEEIKGLKEERDWLRTRIEKLEDKASRDQLLLLSETQTIKALITIQEQRRSPVRLALEWLGFVEPPSVNTSPMTRPEIVVSTPENKRN